MPHPSKTVLHGAARASVLAKLDRAGMLFDDALHERVAVWHTCTCGKAVCGCEICQAYCPCQPTPTGAVGDD